MNEYKVTIGRATFLGWDKSIHFGKANSASEIKAEIEKEFSYEMQYEGVRILDIEKV